MSRFCVNLDFSGDCFIALFGFVRMGGFLFGFIEAIQSFSSSLDFGIFSKKVVLYLRYEWRKQILFMAPEMAG